MAHTGNLCHGKLPSWMRVSPHVSRISGTSPTPNPYHKRCSNILCFLTDTPATINRFLIWCDGKLRLPLCLRRGHLASNEAALVIPAAHLSSPSTRHKVALFPAMMAEGRMDLPDPQLRGRILQKLVSVTVVRLGAYNRIRIKEKLDLILMSIKKIQPWIELLATSEFGQVRPQAEMQQVSRYPPPSLRGISPCPTTDY